MRRFLVAVSILAFAASAASADAISDRQALMKERGKIVGTLAKMTKGELPFEAAEVKNALQALQANAERFDADALFPAGTETGGETTVSPKVWEDMTGFKAAEDKYLANVKAANAAPADDLDTLKTQLGTVGGDCAACHKAFRIKKG
ncbi:MAG: cytochrome c [Mesorhizobium sp.]|jgi:cytochrome c556